jgi:sulfate adenylyltransferase subunit 2
MWNLLNGRLGNGETMRVFPLSNWTEKDVWRYVAREGLEVVPLYFAARRPTIIRDGQVFVINDDRLPLNPGEAVEQRKVRFRTLGCWPVTAATLSSAEDIESVLAETLDARNSERQGRLIDHDSFGAMERKKEEGYF